MTEYTPTTNEVRALYVTGTPRKVSITEGNAEFYRWLAARDAVRDREVAAQALEAFAKTWAEQDGIEALMFARDDVSAVQLTEKAILARAADLRSGTEGSTN